MIVADFHVHSTFSVDGMSTMEQYCIMAMQKGIKKSVLQNMLIITLPSTTWERLTIRNSQ